MRTQEQVKNSLSRLVEQADKAKIQFIEKFEKDPVGALKWFANGTTIIIEQGRIASELFDAMTKKDGGLAKMGWEKWSAHVIDWQKELLVRECPEHQHDRNLREANRTIYRVFSDVLYWP